MGVLQKVINLKCFSEKAYRDIVGTNCNRQHPPHIAKYVNFDFILTFSVGLPEAACNCQGILYFRSNINKEICIQNMKKIHIN